MSCFASARVSPSRLYIFGVPRYTFLQDEHPSQQVRHEHNDFLTGSNILRLKCACTACANSAAELPNA